jgi:hypothetical protein
MVKLQKAGGIAALVEALAYIVGFAVIATLLNPGNTDGWSAAQKLAFVLERKGIFQAWNLFIYVFFGVALVVLTVALHERFKAKSAALMQIATPFGLIWAGLVIAAGMVATVGLESVAKLYLTEPVQAVSAWFTISVIHNGLGGGVEIVGGIWLLLVSVAALQSGALAKVLNYIGIVVGLTGIVTVIPALSDLGAVFGIGQILWFAWIGIRMLRRDYN